MPIYEYRCKKCGNEFEMFQKITEPSLTFCMSCKGPVEKLMSLSTFHLKGSGWYVTDYGGKKAPTGDAKKEDKAPETAVSTDAGESGSASE